MSLVHRYIISLVAIFAMTLWDIKIMHVNGSTNPAFPPVEGHLQLALVGRFYRVMDLW